MRASHQAGIVELESRVGQNREKSGGTEVPTVPSVLTAKMPSVSAKAVTGDIILIEDRSFFRECITHALKKDFVEKITSFPSLDHWLEVAEQYSAAVILLSGPGWPADSELEEILDRIVPTTNQVPVILLCDSDDPERIVTALKKGVRGYIPTSLPLDVVAQALRLVFAGGIFAPANSIFAARRLGSHSLEAKTMGGLFTARQAAVVEKLRIGKANKTIAYELNMCESTVKVHVRNIMKKLKAKNRTEVAFIANRLSNSVFDVRSDRKF